MRLIQDILDGLSSLFFPPICKGCGQRMDANEGVVCEKCWQKLCLFPPDELQKKIIPANLEFVWPVFQFDEIFQRIVHALKYQENVSLGYELGRRMAYHLPPQFRDYEPIVLVPIPLHPIKLRERGYNQSEAIARGLSAVLGSAIEPELLIRIKNTVTQTKLNAVERQANMQAAFDINKKKDTNHGNTIVLVDDVFTTGATLDSASRMLRQAGFAKIIAITAAAPV